ncbi:DUF4167 domain-containing protein [Rhizobium sp. CRIBSB]|nr:DUF4167 domain-containing protein [Rhizobium sp. CRIBSB]
MRDFKGMKRQRGRNRKPGGNPANNNNTNPNRSWDSQGPENMKVRGNAQTVYERYLQLARDAAASGDRVLGENYLQHAEHYFRVLRALQPARPVSEIAARELSNQGFDIDFEDESGAQAAAIIAAHQAELARQQQAQQPQGGQSQNNPPRDYQGRDYQPREYQPRDNAGEDAETPQRERQSRAEGDNGNDGRPRETRRERWERRNAERAARRLAEGGESEAMDASVSEAEDADDGPVEAPRPESSREDRQPRRERAPRAPRPALDDADGPQALPGFLTRSAAPPAPAEDVPDNAGEASVAAPKKRAPRRKAEAPVDSEA